MGANGGHFAGWILGSILTLFTIFDISPLWMDQFWKNWWPNCRFFDARTDSDKILYRYDPQNFWETLEAGAKKWIFSPFWLLKSLNFSASELDKDKKSVSKLNYYSRANQWCIQHINMLKQINLAELQRSVGMIKCHFGNFGHFWPKIGPLRLWNLT